MVWIGQAFAYLAKIEGRPVNEQVGLWSEALSHYAKAQLYSADGYDQTQDSFF